MNMRKYMFRFTHQHDYPKNNKKKGKTFEDIYFQQSVCDKYKIDLGLDQCVLNIYIHINFCAKIIEKYYDLVEWGS